MVVSPPQDASGSSDLPPLIPPPTVDEGFTAADLIARQEALEREARDAIPFSFSSCTHEKGYIRQPVYACKTCGSGGVCAGCSVSCHAEHDLIELFAKRHFRCDCGTFSLYRLPSPDARPAVPQACTLRKPGIDGENEENVYGQNFQGTFCYCERGKAYNPETEDETMFQCLACEEWLHESCTSLVPSSSTSFPSISGTASAAADAVQPNKDSNSTSAPGADATEESSPDDALIDHDAFDLMLCDACVRAPANAVLRHYVGVSGWAAVLPATKAPAPSTEWDGTKVQGRGEWVVVGLKEDAAEESGAGEAEPGTQVDASIPMTTAGPPNTADEGVGSKDAPTTTTTTNGETDAAQSQSRPAKRVSSPTPDASSTAGDQPPPLKRARPETAENTGSTTAAPASAGKCRLPPLLPVAKESESASAEDSKDEKHPRLDIFLAPDFRDRICRCEACLPLWSSLPFILSEEVTYSPPSASSSGSDSAAGSTYDLGLAALHRLPRERMIDSLDAYARFRDELFDHLRPFSQTGRPVTEEIIRSFFESRMGGTGK